jgi:hypothetical protein
MNLRDVLDEVAASLPGIEATSGPDSATIWKRSGLPFAVLSADAGTAEFALETIVARAAARTPDAMESDRHGGWVRFQPAAIDDYAVDRAVAWYQSAYRRLATAGS